MRRILTAYLLAALTGCASVQVLESPQVAQKVGTNPAIGVTTTVPVGGTVFSQFSYWSKTGYRLLGPVQVGLGLGRVVAADGASLFGSVANGKPAFCTEQFSYVDPIVGPFKTACFLDTNNSGSFSAVTAAPGVIWFESALVPPVPYEKSEVVLPRKDSFKYELLYQGLSNKTLRLSYREFANDMARPAYFQDVAYEVEKFPTTITFRSVRIEVLAADNNGLTHRVLSAF